MLILVIGIELARPIIVGVAVDDIISNYEEIVEETVDGETYIRRLVIGKDGKSYYLVDNMLKTDYEEGFDKGVIIEESTDQMTMSISNQEYIFSKVTKDEISEFRSNDFSRLAWYTGLFLFVTVLDY